MKYYIPAATALFLMASPATAETIDYIVREIERNNPELRGTAVENKATLQEADAANLPGATSIEFNPFFERGGISSSEFIVKQDFDFPTLYTTRHKLGKAQEEEMNASADEARRQLGAEARKKLIEYCMTRDLDKLLSERIALNNRLQKGLAQKEELQEATAADIALARLDAIDLSTEQAQNRVTIQRLQREITAMNGGKEIDFNSIDSPQPIMNIPDGKELEVLAAKSGSVKSAEAAVASSRQEVSVARNGWAPGLSVGYRMETEGKSAAHGMMIGIGFDLFGAGGRVKAAKSRENAAILKAEGSRLNQLAEQEALVSEMRETLELMKAYDISSLDKTSELLDIALFKGAMTIEDYTEGMDKILSRKAEYERLRYQLLTLEADLYK